MCSEPSLAQLLAQGNISETIFQKERERQEEERERQEMERERKIQAIKERLSRAELSPERRLMLEKMLDGLEIGL